MKLWRLREYWRQHHYRRGPAGGAGARAGGRRPDEFATFEGEAVREFFETSGRNLLAAAAAAGVKRYVGGRDRAAPEERLFTWQDRPEELIRRSGIPHTIVH